MTDPSHAHPHPPPTPPPSPRSPEMRLARVSYYAAVGGAVVLSLIAFLWVFLGGD